MYRGWGVGVVIPARDEEAHISVVINTIPNWVDAIIIVDDGSIDSTEIYAQQELQARRESGWIGLGLICNSGGIGVGGAIDFGHRHLLKQHEKGAFCQNERWASVVMAGDGQMDPDDLSALLDPLISESAHHVKGNRKIHRGGLKGMPKQRKIGTWLLKHLTNLAAGLQIGDPQCGYTATSHVVLKSWNFDRSWKGYGYPNHWLMRLSTDTWRITEVPVKAIYSGQKSGIRIPTFFAKVAVMLWLGLFERGWKWHLKGMVDGSGTVVGALYSLGISLAFFGGWLCLGYALLRMDLIWVTGFLVCMIVARRLDLGVAEQRRVRKFD